MKTKGRNVRRRNSLAWPGLCGLLLLLLSIVMTNACSSGGPYRIDLMPAPAVFEDGEINPLPKGQPPVSYDDFRMLYTTEWFKVCSNVSLRTSLSIASYP